MFIIYLLKAVLVIGLMNPNEAHEISSKRVDRLLEIESLATPPRRALFGSGLDTVVGLGEGIINTGAEWGDVTWSFVEGTGSDGVNHMRKAGVELAEATTDVADVFADVSFNDIVSWIQDAYLFFNCAQPSGCLVNGIEVTGCTPGQSQCIVEYSGSCLAFNHKFGMQSSYVLAQNDNAALTVSAKAEAEVTSEAAVILYLDSRSKVRVELTPPVVTVDAEAKFELTATGELLNQKKRIELATLHIVVRRVFMAGPIPVLVVVTAQPVAILTAYGEATVTGSVKYNARGTVTFQDRLWAEINLQTMEVNQNFGTLQRPSIDTQFHDFWTFDASGELGIEFGASVGVELSIAVYETVEFNLFPAVKGSLKTSGSISTKTVAELKTDSQSLSGVVNAQANAQFCLNGEVTGYFDWKQSSRRELAEIDFAAKITAMCEEASAEMCGIAGFLTDVIPICNAVGEIITSVGFPSMLSVPDLDFISLSVDIPGTCLASIELSRELIGFDAAMTQRSIEETTLDNIDCPTDFVGYLGVMSGPGLLDSMTTIPSEEYCRNQCLANTNCNTFEWDSTISRCYHYQTGEEAVNRGIDFNNKICTRIIHICPQNYRHVAGDILGWGFETKEATSEQICANWCNEKTECKAFQYSATMNGNNCALHRHSNINAPTASDMHMCVRSCRSPSAEIPVGFSVNPVAWQIVDYPKSEVSYLGLRKWYADLNGYRGYPVTIDRCQRACGVTIGCRAFQYDTLYSQCWLLREPRFYPASSSWTGYTCEEFSQDCEIGWSSCDENCGRTMMVLKPKIGGGAECPVSVAPGCNHGEDLCPHRTCASHGSGLCEHPSLNRGSTTLCTGSTCSELECCDTKASCESYTATCAHSSLRLGAVQLCPGDASTCNNDICCDKPECTGNRYTFTAGYDNCLTYAQGMGNFDYCDTDLDSSQNYYASQVCRECMRCSQPQVPCLGDSTSRATWDAGYGKCDTYEAPTADSPGNSAWCHLDLNNGFVAEDICSECGKCTI